MDFEDPDARHGVFGIRLGYCLLNGALSQYLGLGIVIHFCHEFGFGLLNGDFYFFTHSKLPLSEILCLSFSVTPMSLECEWF